MSRPASMVGLQFGEALEATLATLATTNVGLTQAEAESRLLRFGPNQFATGQSVSLFLDFLRRFGNPLILVLLAAATISAMAGEVSSFVIIVTIVCVSISLDFWQERRADKAMEVLRQRVALRTDVLRDGNICERNSSEIVPGDVVSLCAGDLVPGDCRLLEVKDLFVNEALITGEAFPAEKHLVNLPAEASVPSNAIFMGSSVVSGTAKAVVLRTGRSTQMGAIAHTLETKPDTAFTIGMRSFGYLIVRLTILLVLFVILVNLLFHRPVIESFLFALALAVGLTPELLPMVISVTLANGAIRMAKKKVIVKRPSAIHDLGSMDILCSDKTGTLTEAKITLVKEVDLCGKQSADALQLAGVNAAFETGVKSPLDQAIMSGAKTDTSAWRKLDEVPFDFERRRVSILAETTNRRVLIVKGAPEDILAISDCYESDETTSALALDQPARQRAATSIADFGKDGFRVLGVAWRTFEQDRLDGVADERGLTFAGFVLFMDPPKSGAQEALKALSKLGIVVKIVTGDNEHIARHVCRSLGMEIPKVLIGDEMDGLTDEALAARVEAVNLFCRVKPMQKARVIRALRRRGHVVGYLGDGINDAPSINAADAGLSVSNAVDVAKQAASIILLENDLSVLAEGVREGRRTFANILKYVTMGTSSNFGNMFSMAGAVLVLPFLPMLPFQILLNNLIYDLSEVAIPLDRVDEELVVRPHRWNMTFVRNVMLVLGPISSLFDFVTFGTLLYLFGANEAVFQTGWFVESLITQVLVIFVIRTRGNPFKSRPHPALLASSLAAIFLAVTLPYSPLSSWLHFVPLPISVLGTLAGISAVYLLAVEGVKWLARSQIAAI